MRFKHAIIGGTFDHLHKGHVALITRAFEVADRVSIGITTSSMNQDKDFVDLIEDYDIRKRIIEDFLTIHNLLSRSTLIPIKDKYGSILTDPTIEAIIVSPETEKVAHQIVQERTNKGLKRIEIIVEPFVKDDINEIISSQRIRGGQIDNSGLSYLNNFQKKPKYLLPKSLRAQLQEPFGDVYTDTEKLKTIIKPENLLITVGDIVTTSLLSRGMIPDISIVDFRTRREELKKSVIDRYFAGSKSELLNPAGTINTDFAKLFLDKIQKHTKGQIIRIEGEEDLLTLPVILLSPLRTLVIYGQHKVGMITVEVTEEKKKIILNFLSQFN